MSAGARPSRQAAGSTPLGLALLLERSGVRLVAPTQTLAPGIELLEFVASFPGPRPATAASCRERPCQADLLRLRVGAAALLDWVRARLEAAQLPGWRVEHVASDMSERADDPWAWTLTGVADSGAAVWLRIELQLHPEGGRLGVSARRCWLLGPSELACGRIWRALVRWLGRGPGLTGRGERLMIDVVRASLGPGFAAAGWRLPGSAALRLGLEVTGDALVLGLAARASVVSWPEGQVDDGRAEGPEDPLAQVRGWLRGGPTARALADAALQELAAQHPVVAGALLRARALALRFVARDRCVAALHAWLGVAPEDREARWLLAVQHAMSGARAALLEVLRQGGNGVRERLALALVLQQEKDGAAEARAHLEGLVGEVAECAAPLQAAVWRGLARSRAGDRATPAMAVLAAVSAALGEEGWRRREEAGELRAQVAAALVASGRPEAETTPLLRRLLGDVRPGRWDRPGQRVEVAAGRTSARLVSEYLAQEGRWSELVAVLGRQLVRLGGVPRIQTLRRIARIHRHHLYDPASAEQALRVALEQPAEDEASSRALDEVRAELATCLEMQGAALQPGEELAVGAAVMDEGREVAVSDASASGSSIAEVAVSDGSASDSSIMEVVALDVSASDSSIAEVAVSDAPASDPSIAEVAVSDAPADSAIELDVLGDRRDGRDSGVIAARLQALSLALEGLGRGASAQFGELLAMTEELAGLLDLSGATIEDRPCLQLGAFLAPRGPIAEAVGGWPSGSFTGDVWAQEPEPEAESRSALRAALRTMAGATAGIRAPGMLQGSQGPQDVQALALAEAELGPLRAALGLELPVRVGCGAADGGVVVRNERPPTIGVGAALVGLGAGERRFRLGFAAAMIAGGLAIVTDPQGASLPELLAALHHLADGSGPLLIEIKIKLPGAQTIVRALAARGFTGEQLPLALREALVREIADWQQSRASVAHLAQLLRRDCLQVALRLSGALDGALATIGRDARLPGPPDEKGKLQVLASPDGQYLLRAAGLIASHD